MTRDDKAASKPPADDKPDRTPLGEIDDNLRRVYREMVEKEVPDRFQRLIDELRKQDDRA